MFYYFFFFFKYSQLHTILVVGIDGGGVNTNKQNQNIRITEKLHNNAVDRRSEDTARNTMPAESIAQWDTDDGHTHTHALTRALRNGPIEIKRCAKKNMHHTAATKAPALEKNTHPSRIGIYIFFILFAMTHNSYSDATPH